MEGCVRRWREGEVGVHRVGTGDRAGVCSVLSVLFLLRLCMLALYLHLPLSAFRVSFTSTFFNLKLLLGGQSDQLY